MKQFNFFSKLLFICFLLVKANIASAQVYCAPTFASGCSLWRNQSISVGSINWTAPSTCTLWDFTTMSTTITAGTPLPMTVTNGDWCGCSVWVDFNADGDFDDLGENLYSLYGGSASHTYNFNLLLPGSTPNGLYRMRVIASWGSDGVTVGPNGYGGCGAYQYGNYDDFTLNVGGVAPCLPPGGLSATAITTTSANLSWSSVLGAIGYEYVVSTTSGSPSGPGIPTVATNYNAVGLTPGTINYLHVRTNCGLSFSPWTTIPFTTLSPCLAPATLNATSITTTSALLSWSSIAGVSGYEYAVNTSAASPTGSGIATLGLNYNASGLTAATLYYLHVRTNCGSGNFSPWNSIPFTTLSICNQPGGLTASSITNNSAALTWNSVAGAAGYEYVVDNSVANPSGPGTATVSTSYNAISLIGGTSYYLHVRANCGGGNFSAWSTIPFTTLPPCSSPTNLQSNAVTGTSANLSWTAVTGVTTYEYAVNTSSTPPSGTGTPIASTTYNAVSLTPLTVYYLHVRSYCGPNNYSAWATYSFTTKAPNGLDDVDKDGFSFMIYPNPLKDIIQISVGKKKGASTITLFDLEGRIIENFNNNFDGQQLDLSHLNAGMYFLKYEDAEHTRTIKLHKL